MTQIKVSPAYSLGQLQTADIQTKIDIFEDRVKGWQLCVGQALWAEVTKPKDGNPDFTHAGFAVLSILFSYFEMIRQFQRGEESAQQAGTFAKEGLLSVYGATLSEQQRDQIYRDVRCGMYHSGITKALATISGDSTQAFTFIQNRVCVNPGILCKDILQHFDGYLEMLRADTDSDARAHFEEMLEVYVPK